MVVSILQLDDNQLDLNNLLQSTNLSLRVILFKCKQYRRKVEWNVHTAPSIVVL